MLDLDIVAQQALHYAYAEIANAVPQLKIMLATYFGGLGDNLRYRAGAARRRPASRSGARAGTDSTASPILPADRVLSLGVIDGRNIWRADLSRMPRPARTRDRETRQRPRADRAVLLAAARPDRSGAGNRARRRTRRAGWRSRCRSSSELATLGDGAAPSGRGSRRGRPASSDEAAAAAQGLAADPRCESRRAHRRSRRRHASRAHSAFAERVGVQQRALRPAGLPDHDDRLVPADRRGAQGARRARQGRP